MAPAKAVGVGGGGAHSAVAPSLPGAVVYLSLEQELEQSPGRCQVSVDGVPGGGGQRSGRSESF